MKRVKLLDVSLRDGGHRTNFYFKANELEQILMPLDEANLDYIEIGYRNGSLHPIANIGEAGLCPKGYLEACANLIKKTKIAVMVHPQNVNLVDLKELKEASVKLIRVCLSFNEAEVAFPTIEICQDLGLGVSINFIHMSYYKEDEMDKVVQKIIPKEVDAIYFADSNGSMMPKRVASIYKKYTELYKTPFGYHAHDNLGLAQANAIAALDNGAEYIDVSLAGMGKGIGNLKTEFFIAYLEALGLRKYNLDAALSASNYVRQALNIGHEDIEMDEFIRGITDLSTADLAKYKEKNINEKNTRLSSRHG
ncbi:MAG: 4-hydroxy-2-oxovalerate aldolase [Proteobacteria bacterium]|nr:4-hydroxy-2-oxovalerate aldolase [Pseudomonadota bacterium]